MSEKNMFSGKVITNKDFEPNKNKNINYKDDCVQSQAAQNAGGPDHETSGTVKRSQLNEYKKRTGRDWINNTGEVVEVIEDAGNSR